MSGSTGAHDAFEGGAILSAGIDVGSSSVKVAVMRSPRHSGRAREGAEVLSTHIERLRRRDPLQVVDVAYAEALRGAELSPEAIDYVATTGEGEHVEFRTGHFYGMTAHARGALFIDPEARAAMDAGALHARAVKFDEGGRVLGYRMTSQCASGTGQFLENIARYLGVTLDEVGPLSLGAKRPEKVSSICAVLAETDVINMVSRGIALADILAGIHESMAGRFAKLLRAVKVTGPVLLTGGLAADEGLLEATREAAVAARLTGIEVRSHALSVYAGSLGAALWGGLPARTPAGAARGDGRPVRCLGGRARDGIGGGACSSTRRRASACTPSCRWRAPTSA